MRMTTLPPECWGETTDVSCSDLTDCPAQRLTPIAKSPKASGWPSALSDCGSPAPTALRIWVPTRRRPGTSTSAMRCRLLAGLALPWLGWDFVTYLLADPPGCAKVRKCPKHRFPGSDPHANGYQMRQTRIWLSRCPRRCKSCKSPVPLLRDDTDFDVTLPEEGSRQPLWFATCR